VARDIVNHFEGLEEGDARSTSMGAAGEDVLLSPLARQRFPFTVEVKNCEQLALGTWWRQARAHRPCAPTLNVHALLILGGNRQPVIAMLSREVCAALFPDHAGTTIQEEPVHRRAVERARRNEIVWTTIIDHCVPEGHRDVTHVACVAWKTLLTWCHREGLPAAAREQTPA